MKIAAVAGDEDENDCIITETKTTAASHLRDCSATSSGRLTAAAILPLCRTMSERHSLRGDILCRGYRNQLRLFFAESNQRPPYAVGDGVATCALQFCRDGRAGDNAHIHQPPSFAPLVVGENAGDGAGFAQGEIGQLPFG